MFLLNRLAAAGALALSAVVSIASPNPANAGPIMGSLTLTSDGVLDNGLDLLMRSTFQPVGLHVGLTTGDFNLIPSGTSITGGLLDLGNLNTFTFTVAGEGTFTDNGINNEIVTRTASNLDVYLVGDFTPMAGGNLDAFSPSSSSVRLALTRTGSGQNVSVSFGGTEAAPPVAPPVGVSEPATMALLGTSLLGLGFVARRRIGGPIKTV